MIIRIVEFALTQRAFILTLGVLLLFGGLYAYHSLDVAVYPDPAPPMVEVITQYPGWSAEEIERIITIPIEVSVGGGMRGLSHIRSLSIFGLSDIKFYFNFGTDFWADRQEVINRLGMMDFPAGVSPALSPWWSIAEIYRYEVVGDGYSLTDLKTLQDWVLYRQFRRVPGVVDVTAFGGTTKQYHVDVDPGRLISYNVTLPQVITALTNSNANAGGNYVSIGDQSFNVRGLGLINDLDDIEDVVVAETAGTPIYVKNLAKVSVDHRIRLGKVGIDDRNDVVEGVVLLQRGYQALPVLERVKQKVAELNTVRLPKGVQVKPVYDRTVLIHATIETVTHILIMGIILVFVILFIFLGHVQAALIVALAVPMALLFTFSLMVMAGQSANLISLGAIDFGIIVDSTLLMVERIFTQLVHQQSSARTVPVQIMRAARDVGRPVFFATMIIIVAFVPLFTMTGVPGKIFAPMSITYGLALSGALLIAFTLAPVLCSLLLTGPFREHDTPVVRIIRRLYLKALQWALDHEMIVIGAALALFLLSLAMVPFLGGEFMPPLEEGNLWVRATMPVDISFEQAGRLATEIRGIFRRFPEVTTAVSQLGRPDDGTDPTSFFNAEFLVGLKPRKEWRAEITSKDTLIQEIEAELGRIPGVIFNFSQVIQDNVQEAMSGVKGENSIKLFGRDLKILEANALEIEQVMKQVGGVKDLGIFHLRGQPNLLIAVDRQACARYGLEVSDVNGVIQAAIGGQAVTQVYEGERWFDLVVRFLPEFRQDMETIGSIQVNTPDGTRRIPLKQLANISMSTGAFIIYRENNERYIPIKFSVRGRDLESTVKEAAALIGERVSLPEGYRIEWHGEYSQLQEEKQRLARIVPLSLLVILLLAYLALNSFRDAVLVLCAVPFALSGGIFALALTGTDFSISAAVGFVSLFGIAVQGGLVDLSRIPAFLAEGYDLRTAILKNAEVRMRPVLMTSLAAAIGLLPAAMATGMGAQSQQPLARVVVGGMISSPLLILMVLPVLYQFVHRAQRKNGPADDWKDADGDVRSRRRSLGRDTVPGHIGQQPSAGAEQPQEHDG